MLSELDMMSLWAKQLTGYASQWERLFGFGYAVEAEVRKQDDALIGRMLEVLEYVRNTPEAEYDSKAALSKAQAAITAAIARLSERRNAS